jgi:hypothetical protein
VSCARLLLDPQSELERLTWRQLQRLAKNLDIRDPKRPKWEVLPEDDESFLPMFAEQIIYHILLPVKIEDAPTGIVTFEYRGRPSANHHLRDCNGKTPVQIAGLERVDRNGWQLAPSVVQDQKGLANLHAHLKELIEMREREGLEEDEKRQVRKQFDAQVNGAELLVGWEVDLLPTPPAPERSMRRGTAPVAVEMAPVQAIVYDKKEPTGILGFGGSWENRVAVFDSRSQRPEELLKIDFKAMRGEYHGFRLLRRLPPGELDQVSAQVDRLYEMQKERAGAAKVENHTSLATLGRRSTLASLAFLPPDMVGQLERMHVSATAGRSRELLQKALAIETAGKDPALTRQDSDEERYPKVNPDPNGKSDALFLLVDDASHFGEPENSTPLAPWKEPPCAHKQSAVACGR